MGHKVLHSKFVKNIRRLIKAGVESSITFDVTEMFACNLNIYSNQIHS